MTTMGVFALEVTAMAEPKCPCEVCLARKYMAIAFDMHVWGDDCPYVCKPYEEWSRRAGDGNE